MGTWRTLHLRRILHAPCAISMHGNFQPGEPRTRASRAPTTLPTGQLRPLFRMGHFTGTYFKKILRPVKLSQKY